MGANRLECRTCPYQFMLEKRYYERRVMKRKEVEDVMGGPGAWDNVDQTDGTPSSFDLIFRLRRPSRCSAVSDRGLRWQQSLLHADADSKRRRTHDVLLQGAHILIRADEPAEPLKVHDVRRKVERMILVGFQSSPRTRSIALRIERERARPDSFFNHPPHRFGAQNFASKALLLKQSQ